MSPICRSGARLQSYSALRKGVTNSLTFPEIGPIAAEVMWADDFLAGCQFHEPFDKQVFEQRAAPETFPGKWRKRWDSNPR